MDELTPLHLGKTSKLPTNPDEAMLDAVPNPQFGTLFVARFTCPEFSSLCPVTGAPDFATIVIDYVPARSLLESKSLKLFLHSFRNHGAFHEDCTVTVGKRIQTAIKPTWIRVCGYWFPRGGIPIDVSFQWPGNPPEGVHVPPFEMPLYRGR